MQSGGGGQDVTYFRQIWCIGYALACLTVTDADENLIIKIHSLGVFMCSIVSHMVSKSGFMAKYYTGA